MSTGPSIPITKASGNSKCLVRSVAEALAEEPALEAITLDRAGQTVSIATLGPADEARLGERITAALRRVQAAARDQRCGLLDGSGGDCATCNAPLSERERRGVNISTEGGATTIARVTCPTAPKFWRWRRMPWPRVVQRHVEFLEHVEEMDEWKHQLLAAALCGTCGLAGYFLPAGAPSLAAYALAYVAGSWFTVQEVHHRARQGSIDVHFLMLAVAAGSASIGAWGEGALLLFLFSLSGALEHFALGRTQREIRSLFKQAPKVATVLGENGEEQEVPVEQLRPGLRLLLKPGAQFPADAEIVSGHTAADESTLTGEAVPVEKKRGDTVFAGTMNLWGAVEAAVLRPAAESALQKIIRLIRDAQQQKAPAQQFTDRFGTCYTYIVLGLSVAMFFVWWLGLGLEPFRSSSASPSAFYRTMTLLVVASPCALVLSIPSAILAAIAWGARRGVLFRGGAAVEKLAEVKVVALDKTGTLTTGELQVDRVESFPPGREEEVTQLAYSLERLSTHPLARAITRYGKQHELRAVGIDHFESVPGQGLQARHGGKACFLGRREWMTRSGAGVRPGFTADAAWSSGRPDTVVIARLPPLAAGFSEVWVAEDDLLGRILLRDDVRPQARHVLEQLRREGLRTVVLTGDRQATGEQLKTELELDDVRAELKPEQKVAVIRSFTQAGQLVAMVGDGVNDAPSLAAAHIGVAMGARGADAALEQADVVLMHDRLENFLAAFRLSKRARQIIKQNLVLSLGTVVVLVLSALFGILPLTIGVAGHEGSTVVVVLNSLRLLFGGARPGEPGAQASKPAVSPTSKSAS